jgi:lactoylglutathione lyase
MTSIADVRTIAVPVSDQERALSFYRDTVGFAVRYDSGPPPALARGGPSGWRRHDRARAHGPT